MSDLRQVVVGGDHQAGVTESSSTLGMGFECFALGEALESASGAVLAAHVEAWGNERYCRLYTRDMWQLWSFMKTPML